MSLIFTKRLTKELKDLSTSPPAGITIDKVKESDLRQWTLKLQGAQGTLYQDEEFTLQFKFSNNYPLESPEVIFVGTIPVHPHIYSNGHICLSILYDQWTPALTVASVCLSIQSMLSSCQTKERPVDNDRYVAHATKSPKETVWNFHGKSTLYILDISLYSHILVNKTTRSDPPFAGTTFGIPIKNTERCRLCF